MMKQSYHIDIAGYAMISDTVRRSVWHNLFEASRVARFYTVLKNRLVWQRRFIRFLLSVAGAIAALPLATDDFAWIAPWAGLAVVILVLFDSAMQYDDKISQFGRVSAKLRSVRREYRALWEAVEDEESVPDLQNEIGRLESEIASAVNDLDIAPHKKLNKACAEAAYKEEKERYVIG